jgi:hypothetical protein
MTVNYQPNPLNTFQLRQLDHCPPHFYAVDFHISVAEKKISDWIWEHLHGRFFLGDTYSVTRDSDSNKKYVSVSKRAAFEIHGEASYFAMVLNEINKF